MTSRLEGVSVNDVLNRDFLWAKAPPAWLDKYGIVFRLPGESSPTGPTWPTPGIVPLDSPMWDEVGRFFEGGAAAARALAEVWYGPTAEELDELRMVVALGFPDTNGLHKKYAPSPNYDGTYPFNFLYLSEGRILSDMSYSGPGADQSSYWKEDVSLIRQLRSQIEGLGIDYERFCRDALIAYNLPILGVERFGVSQEDFFFPLSPDEAAFFNASAAKIATVMDDPSLPCTLDVNYTYSRAAYNVEYRGRAEELRALQLDPARLAADPFFSPSWYPGIPYGGYFGSVPYVEGGFQGYKSEGGFEFRFVTDWPGMMSFADLSFSSSWGEFRILLRNVATAVKVFQDYPWPNVTFAGQAERFFRGAEYSGCPVCAEDQKVKPGSFHRYVATPQILTPEAVRFALTFIFVSLLPQMAKMAEIEIHDATEAAKKRIRNMRIFVGIAGAVLSVVSMFAGAPLVLGLLSPTTLLSTGLQAINYLQMRQTIADLKSLAAAFGGESPAFQAEVKRVVDAIEATMAAFLKSLKETADGLGIVIGGNATQADFDALQAALNVFNGTVEDIATYKAILAAAGLALPAGTTSTNPSDLESALGALGQAQQDQQQGTVTSGGIPVENIVPPAGGTTPSSVVSQGAGGVPTLDVPESQQVKDIVSSPKTSFVIPAAGIGAGGLLAFLLFR